MNTEDLDLSIREGERCADAARRVALEHDVPFGTARNWVRGINKPSNKRLGSRPLAEVNDKLRELCDNAVPGKCYTLEEIGDYAGVTKERVRQIEMQALKKLRLTPTIRQLKEECS
jgi:hypothetical protein